MIINTNTNALTVQKAVASNERDLSKAVEQLSTGRRINSAADDAAGIAIRNKMASQIRSLDMAVRNANDGISMLQTADGASEQLTTMLTRMRELAIQAGNDVYSDEQRESLHEEVSELQAEMTNIIQNTQWNGLNVLDGGAGASGSVQFQVGPQGADSITVSMGTLNTGAVSSALSISVSTRSAANSSIDTIDQAIALIDESRARWGAAVNRLTHAADNASNISMNTKASKSGIDDADYAKATADLAKSLILDQAGAAMLSQANQQPIYVLALLR